ncbi:hypothetical protein Tco_0756806 [Tanacetum coccineum]
MGANGGVEGVNGNVEGANGGALDFSTIIAQKLQNLLPAMLAHVSNRGNVRNQNEPLPDLQALFGKLFEENRQQSSFNGILANSELSLL